MRRFDREGSRNTPIAIVGMSCRLPGASDLDGLWGVLERGERRFEPLPRERWNPEFDAVELPPGFEPRACERGGLLPEANFDWRTLRIPPAQAKRMHRMELAALSTMVDAMRDASIEPTGVAWPRVRVIIASTTLGRDPRVDHGRRIRRFELHEPIRRALAHLQSDEASALEREIIGAFEASAPPVEPDSMMTSASIVAGRLANIFNLQGGHMAVDAGFASSLAAIREAAISMRLGECDIALVCAISPLLTSSSLLAAAHAGLLGAGVPRPFAPGAEGSLLAEGAGAIVLARPEAIANRRIYAWLEGIDAMPSGLDGELPGPIAGAVAQALALSKRSATAVRFVESRALGVHEHDGSETRGLAFGYQSAGREQPLALSSTVANFGFLGPAAGMIATIKAALCLQRGRWLGQPVEDEFELEPGLDVAARSLECRPDEVVGVSDAGVDAVAFHAILAAPAAHVAGALPIPRLASRKQEIAVVGLGVEVPGAHGVDEFWAKVLARVEAINDMPPSRWDVDLVVGSDPGVASVLHTRLAATVDDPALDDDALWRPLADEREHFDPAVILSLQVAREALRSAKWQAGRWDPRRVGVVYGQLPLRAREAEAEKRTLFAAQLALATRILRERGVEPERIAALLAAARLEFDTDRRIGARPLDRHAYDYQTGMPCAHRVAALFGFRGFALSVDAACASSLAAVHIGVDSLLLGESDAVIAGGVAFNLLPEYYIALSVLGALSPRGAPPFTIGADGFVPGEGAGAIVLRRLEDAQAAGEPILAVVRGLGFGSDGRGVSIFAPNPAGERRAITRALSDAGLRPSSVDYVEAHGTGTRLGDETELGSVEQTYGRRDRATPLSMSSVKSQVGHLSSAAGIIGLIKATLALHEQVIPGGCGDGRPVPAFDTSRIALADRSRPWIREGGRFVGVSSFGLGGANYHVILGDHRDERAATRPELEHPVAAPVREQEADRFIVELVPLERPVRPSAFPLAGKHLLILPDPAGVIARVLDAELQARGASSIQLDAELLEAETLSEALEQHIRELFADPARPCDGILDARSFAPPRGDEDEFLVALDQFNRETFAILRGAYERLASGQPACYVALTAMGGDLGLMGCEAGSLLGAHVLGISKGLKQELPHLQAKTIDFDRAVDPDEVARTALDELEDGNDRMEVGWAGRRFVTNLERRNFAADDPVVRRLQHGDVFVFSGGSRGVVFECALALARLGVQVVVSGRTEEPDPNASWLGLDEEGFENFRRQLLDKRRREDPRLTPVVFAREFDRYRQQRELHRNLARARALGLPVHYEICDVADRSSVKTMVERVRVRFGRIDGVAHGAMVEWSRSLPSKTDDIVRKTTMVKVAGLLHLIDATRNDALKVFVAFGSGAGRFGNRGQIDYSGANALMAVTLRAKTRDVLQRTHCVTIDWTAWREVGAAADDPDLAQRVRETGVSSISVEEGVWHFVNEVFLGDDHEVVIFSEDMQWKWFGLGSQGEGQGERRKWTDDRGAPLVPGEWPMIDRAMRALDSPRIEFERVLDLRDDHFLAEHRLHDAPILPATFGCELVTEGAVLANPGFEFEALEAFEVGAPAKLGSNGLLELRGRVTLLEDQGEHRVVEVATHSDLVLRGRVLQANRMHHRARVVLRRSSGEAPAIVTSLVAPVDDGSPLRSRSVFALSSDPVVLGPQFLRAQWLRVVDDEITGTIRPPRERAIMARSAMPHFQVDPMVLDTAFQIAANWDGIAHGWVSVPMAVARLQVGSRRRRAGEVTRVRAQIVRLEDPDVFYRITVFGEDDEPLLYVEDLHLRRAGRIAARLLGRSDYDSEPAPQLG
jgi:acyl transferase domain-containing protein/NAD(P)-dependent dehydrogenase (short-subunit alcohol dehydrogenase family)